MYVSETHCCTARTLTSAADAATIEVDPDGNPQGEFDRVYSVMLKMLDDYYQERIIIITSADPPYVTPYIKSMLRRKNRLMRSGNVDKAAALAKKVGRAIQNYNTAELSKVDVLSDTSSMWAKVRQLTGRDKSSDMCTAAVTADELNDHYAAISTDAQYTAPAVIQTVNDRLASVHTTEWRMFTILDKLKPTATGLDELPAWFLRIVCQAASRHDDSVHLISCCTKPVETCFNPSCC